LDEWIFKWNCTGQSPKPTIAPAESAPAVNKITIVYGTETGNSKRLATDFATKAKQKHIHAKVVGMDQYRLADLSKEEFLLAVISTHGEGAPPAAAQKFYDHIHKNGFKLENVKIQCLWH
jgi:sulfite reductase (NADPH) flavoprotein alpha-component